MDDQMALTTTALARRFEGRLFLEDGRLYFVLDVDTNLGIARVSCQIDARQQVIEMPISEVALRLSVGSNPPLDGLSTTDMSGRIVQKTDGWYFTTREGLKGPYSSNAEAKQALNKHILRVQGAKAAVKGRSLN